MVRNENSMGEFLAIMKTIYQLAQHGHKTKWSNNGIIRNIGIEGKYEKTLHAIIILLEGK